MVSIQCANVFRLRAWAVCSAELICCFCAESKASVASNSMEAADKRRSRKRKYSLASDITEENPFSCYELCLFAAIYLSCVLFLIIAYEKLMPVFNNPTYPFYNHEFDFTYTPKNVSEK